MFIAGGRPEAPEDCAPHGLEARTRDRVSAGDLRARPGHRRRARPAPRADPAAVRRHLDALVEQGAIEEREPATAGRRGRGRPARAYVALRGRPQRARTATTTTLADVGAALPRRPRRRRTRSPRSPASGVARLEERYADAPRRRRRRPRRPRRRARRGADAPTASPPRPGRSAQGTPLAGVQLCQGHCPVQHVAAEFPAVLRGRDRRVLPPARRARPAPGHPRRTATTSAPPSSRRPAVPGDASTTPPPTLRRKGLSVSTHIEELNPGLKGLGTLRVRLGRRRHRRRHRAAWALEEVVRDISARKNEPRVDARSCG